MSLCVINGGSFLCQMLEDVRDHRWAFNTSDDFDMTAALFTNLNVDIEHALEALHPCHGAMPFFRALVKPIRTALFSLYCNLAALSGCDLNTVFAIWCKNTMKSGQVNTRLGNQRC